ncbi:malonyl-CoA:anthocyanidin 5-O-glucoside-6''-O-malonyltransferase-like [Dorcoceras hygrometricum]|uniref:Malonyl-CoA:anthocyanidin 5-O-glucoside-6''-O-malonyltransferase-like n=1 Tax=Dorcoceras hygrometricum TaxID=472368 RepID=A0A2Z7ATR3_9LAMI|nr:malonyl-CoA:anthocyanidin 5-O-glucoside-6''-O-malonyltransferase-like [Dorcoceras hygrometricum]
MVEQRMRKVVAEHWEEFNKDKPSANQDLMSIHLLEAELAKTRKSLTITTSDEQPAQGEEYQAQAAEQPAQGEEHQAQVEETEAVKSL